MNYLELFLDFLKDERIYTQYIRNYINCYRTNSLDYLKTLNPKFFISGAFDLEETNEGFFFWDKMYSKWIEYISLYNKE